MPGWRLQHLQEVLAEVLGSQLVHRERTKPQEDVVIDERDDDVVMGLGRREALPLEVLLKRMTKSVNLSDWRIEELGRPSKRFWVVRGA